MNKENTEKVAPMLKHYRNRLKRTRSILHWKWNISLRFWAFKLLTKWSNFQEKKNRPFIQWIHKDQKGKKNIPYDYVIPYDLRIQPTLSNNRVQTGTKPRLSFTSLAIYLEPNSDVLPLKYLMLNRKCRSARIEYRQDSIDDNT